MATRKVKHARAMEKRELFFKTIHQGNQNWLKSAQTQRNEERQKSEALAKEKKAQKSRQLAKANKARPQAPKQSTA